MKELYLMRHGETLFNVQKRTQGWSDSPLTEKGIADAQTAGSFMVSLSVDFDHFYSSTQERASDTLELVFPNITYGRLKGLKEQNFGAFEGEGQYLERHDDDWPTFYKKYGGETRHEVAERMKKCLLEVMTADNVQNVFALSHGASMWYFMQEMTEHSDLSALTGLHNLDMLHFEFDEERQIFTFIELIKTLEH